METRIRRNIIILVVVTFLVLIGMCAGWFFVLVRPQREEMANVKIAYEKASETASTLDEKLKLKRKNQDRLDYLSGQLVLFRGSDTDPKITGTGLYRRLYFGDLSSADAKIKDAERDRMWRSWMNEYHYKFGPALSKALTDAAEEAKVGFKVPAITVDDPPQTPEDAEKKVPNNGFLKPLSATNNGTLKLEITAGKFSDILRFLDNITHSDILMVVDKDLKLEGYAPTIKATFTVSPYLVASGPGAKLSATSGGGAASAGGGPGGPRGGPGAGGEGKEGEGAPKEAENKEKKESSAIVAKIKNPRTEASF